MDSGGGAWPKDFDIKQAVEKLGEELGIAIPTNLTLHGLLGIDPATEASLREYLAASYGNDPKNSALYASREDVELSEPMGSLKHSLGDSPRASEAKTHVPWAADEEIHRRLYELLNEQQGQGAKSAAAAAAAAALQQRGQGTLGRVGGPGDESR